jgi:hypothetical protein
MVVDEFQSFTIFSTVVVLLLSLQRLIQRRQTFGFKFCAIVWRFVRLKKAGQQERLSPSRLTSVSLVTNASL